MKQLYVLFDGECALCRRCREWLTRQPAFIHLRFIPLQSPAAAQKFPGLDLRNANEQLVVVSDEGAVYKGPQAWIMCLYALREYREASVRLAHPALLPWARRFCELISQNRLLLSRWFFKANAQDVSQSLAQFDSTAHCEVS
jgi:predicted DCC family thiol-disulfide oxidoreductase YuxK